MSNQSPPFATRAVLALAGIFSFRMLGLFIILPIFALYAHQLRGATPSLIGFALGVYGLTQAIFQIPLAMWSDKIGRKPVIIGGLCIFVLGSIVAACADSIYSIIFGRALQGAGAVGSTVIALAADLTTIDKRTKAMAIIGMSIGASFGIAMVVGPALSAWVGLSGVFWTTALLGVIGIGLCIFSIPHPPKAIFHGDAEPLPALFRTTLCNLELLRLDFGIFALHTLLTASFIVIPQLLAQLSGGAHAHTWMVYLPGLLFAAIVVMPIIRFAEKGGKTRPTFLLAIALLGLSQLCFLLFHASTVQIAITLALFFTAFTFLEAALPSSISKAAPPNSKGTAIGIYSTMQFLGIFAGGSIGGWIYGHFHTTGIFLFGIVLCLVWLLWIYLSRTEVSLSRSA